MTAQPHITPPTASDRASRSLYAFLSKVWRVMEMSAIFVALVAIWHLITMSGAVSPILLPPPLRVAKDLWVVGQNILSGDYIAIALWITLKEVLYGFAIAIVIGFTLGVLVGETKFGERSVMPYLVGIDAMPKIAFAPLFISWLGFGIESKIALAAFMAVFPIVVGTAAGLHATQETERMLFQAIGASRWQTLFRLKLPASLPQFFTGLKIASVGVMAGAITGEFIGGGRGLGELIRISAAQIDTTRVFTLIFYLSIIGIAMFSIVNYAHRKLIFWQKSPNLLTDH